MRRRSRGCASSRGFRFAGFGAACYRLAMVNFDLNRELQFLDALADAARAAILPHFRVGTAAETKRSDQFDPVTEADRGAERAIRALIGAHRPNAGIEGEEYGVTASRDGWTYVIDPVDGTRAFISGLPLWGTLIGLCFEDRPVLGVLDQGYLEERFIGFPGGAVLRDRAGERPLKVRAAGLAQATLATTDPNLFAGAEAGAYNAVRTKAQLTRLGCDCYAYGMVALGGVDLVIESGLKRHDIAALIPIVEGAGGRFTDWRGAPAWGGGQVIAAGAGAAHAEALALLAPAAL
jgi:histidinol phosphatase-like enzyme (inositol monophosphatase family)